MTTDDLPEAFKPYTMENVPPESLTNTWFAKGYNEALEATDAASLYRERNRLRAALNMAAPWLNAPPEVVDAVREALQGSDAQ